MLVDVLSTQLRRNVFSGVVCAGCNAGAIFVAYPIYISCLGLDVYGVWVVLAAIMRFALLGDLGIGQATTKLVAEEHAQQNIVGVQRCITGSLFLLATIGTLLMTLTWLAGAMVLGLFELSAELEATAHCYLPWVGVLSIYAVLSNVCCGALSGIGRMDLANYIQTSGRCLGVSASSLLLLAGFGIISLLTGAFLQYLFVHLCCTLEFRKTCGVGYLILERPRLQILKRIVKFGGGVFSASLVTLALNPFNKLLLCRFSGVSSVPIYDIAFYGTKQVKALAEAALRAMVPEVSRLAAVVSQEASHQIARLNRRAMKLILFLSVPSYCLVLFLMKPILNLWVGPDLARPLAPVMVVMLLASLASLLSVPSYYTLIGVGRVRSIFFASVAKVITNFAVCLIILAVTSTVTPFSLALAVMVALSVSTFYLVAEKSRLLNPLTCGSGPAKCGTGLLPNFRIASRIRVSPSQDAG